MNWRDSEDVESIYEYIARRYASGWEESPETRIVSINAAAKRLFAKYGAPLLSKVILKLAESEHYIDPSLLLDILAFISVEAPGVAPVAAHVLAPAVDAVLSHVVVDEDALYIELPKEELDRIVLNSAATRLSLVNRLADTGLILDPAQEGWIIVGDVPGYVEVKNHWIFILIEVGGKLQLIQKRGVWRCPSSRYNHYTSSRREEIESILVNSGLPADTPVTLVSMRTEEGTAVEEIYRVKLASPPTGPERDDIVYLDVMSPDRVVNLNSDTKRLFRRLGMGESPLVTAGERGGERGGPRPARTFDRSERGSARGRGRGAYRGSVEAAPPGAYRPDGSRRGGREGPRGGREEDGGRGRGGRGSGGRGSGGRGRGRGGRGGRGGQDEDGWHFA
jgi:hypothetical protein